MKSRDFKPQTDLKGGKTDLLVCFFKSELTYLLELMQVKTLLAIHVAVPKSCTTVFTS